MRGILLKQAEGYNVENQKYIIYYPDYEHLSKHTREI